MYGSMEGRPETNLFDIAFRASHINPIYKEYWYMYIVYIESGSIYSIQFMNIFMLLKHT